jgi:hypothetical protein
MTINGSLTISVLTPLTRLRQLDAIFAIFGAFDRDKCLILQSRG